MWLASLGQSERPVAIGVVSNAERSIARTPGVLGIIIDNGDGGALVTDVLPGSGAAAAGIQAGDVITRVADVAVYDRPHLQAEVRKHRIGDVISTVILREHRKLEFSVRLGAPEDVFSDPRTAGRRGPDPSNPSWRGALSQRRDDFPLAIQHDTVLRPNDCGGPVVDSAGRVVGINIARADRTASYAIPGSTITSLLNKIR
jgi:serine protease Do